ncbi:hypothetical protein [Egicoccus sp. AB-alg2]|uniref:hypothetical protein n=1 Tax=Egicoccus sp. AB-alg2 TaxID=3242693 RepID=UPI00359D8B36
MRIVDPPVTFGRALVVDPMPYYRLGQATARQRQRVLDPRAVRGTLPSVGAPPVDVLLQVLFDLSGSMSSGNDAAGLRFEATLIALEHLTAAAPRRSPRWSVQLASFDLDSAVELSPTPLTRRLLLRELCPRLLTRPDGGTSTLGPSLRAAETTANPGMRVLLVLSDFELFDPVSIFDELEASTADLVVALVFNSRGVPPQLESRDLTFHHIAPADEPAIVAHYLIATAQTVTHRTTRAPQRAFRG